MRFARLENAIKTCKEHLRNTPSPELESYLVSYLLLTTYAEYEDVLQRIIEMRIARVAADREVHSFIKSYLRNKKGERKLGRISVADLGGILERFGGSCKSKFTTEVSNKEPHQQWDLIMSNRQSIAHPGGQLQMTFEEFGKAYEKSHAVISAFARACGLTTRDVGNL